MHTLFQVIHYVCVESEQQTNIQFSVTYVLQTITFFFILSTDGLVANMFTKGLLWPVKPILNLRCCWLEYSVKATKEPGKKKDAHLS